MSKVYIASDGRFFENKRQYDNYRVRESADLSSVDMYDGNGELLDDMLSKDTYDNVERIVVNSEDGLRTLEVLNNYYGFYEGLYIDSVGTWIDNGYGEFVREC